MLGHRKRSLTRARIQPHAKDKRDAFGRKYTMTIQGIQAFQGFFRASSRLFASQYERMAAFTLVQPHVIATNACIGALTSHHRVVSRIVSRIV